MMICYMEYQRALLLLRLGFEKTAYEMLWKNKLSMELGLPKHFQIIDVYIKRYSKAILALDTLKELLN